MDQADVMPHAFSAYGEEGLQRQGRQGREGKLFLEEIIGFNQATTT
jgi:hypothetical protein